MHIYYIVTIENYYGRFFQLGQCTMKSPRTDRSTDSYPRRRYASALVGSGIFAIAGCVADGSSDVPVSIDNDDQESHTIAVEVRRATEDTLFSEETSLGPEESRTFEDALAEPSEAETLTANVTVDGTTTSREFGIGGSTGTAELIVNVRSGGEVTVFVAQS